MAASIATQQSPISPVKGASASDSSQAPTEPETAMSGCLAPFTRRAHQVMDQAETKSSATSTASPSEPKILDNGNWANLPAGVLDQVFAMLLASNSTWPRRQSLFAAAGVCSNWRTVAHEVFYHRNTARSTIARPAELFYTRPYKLSTSLLHTLLIRDKVPNGATQYFLYLGEPDQDQHEKFLMAASHHSRFGKHRFCLRLCPEYNPDMEAKDCIASLKTNLLGTSYDLGVEWGGAQETIRNAATSSTLARNNSGSMVYRRNFFGIRGPRKLAVHLPYFADASTEFEDLPAVPRVSSESDSSSHEPVPVMIDDGFLHDEHGRYHLEDDAQDPPPSSGKIHMKNVPPHWHEVLQCWCLNFGGRVKEASVKNFQLMDVSEPDRVAMQFGKISKDRFILDFDPLKIAPVQAFAVALSSFESKLPYE